MSTVEEDKKHIIKTMNRDEQLAKDIAKLSDNALKVLSAVLSDFANNNNEDGEIDASVLSELPSKNDRETLKSIVDDIDVNKNDVDFIEVSNLINGAGKNYKSNKNAYLLSVVTIVFAGLMHKVNNKSAEVSKNEQDAEIAYLTNSNGDLHNIATQKEVNKLNDDIVDIVDEENGSLITNNYKATVDTINNVHTKLINSINQGIAIGAFIGLISMAKVKQATVNTGDIKAKVAKTMIDNNLNGDMQRIDSKFIRNYRTMSAKLDSELKKRIADKYNIKKAIIVNELAPCKYCIEQLNRVYDVEQATAMVPQHPSCRCEVKLLVTKDEVEEYD